ncbi:MAG: penicillin-binding protein activator, partial [bacterium]|nr:penicillin-binding protein activator [bacterium]
LRVRIGSLWVKNCAILEKSESEKVPGYLNIIDGYALLPPDEREDERVPWLLHQDEAEQFLDNWVERGVTPTEQLQKWERIFAGRRSGGIILWKMVQNYRNEGNQAAAQETADYFFKFYPKHPYASLALTIIDKTPPETGESGLTIGLLAPFSGKYRIAAESVLHGLECAAGIFQPCPQEESIRLIVRDAEEGSARQFQELVADGSMAIIALLDESQIPSVTEQANQSKIPLLLLSPKSSVHSLLGDYVFRNFLTIEEQVKTIIQYACEKEKRSYGALYPETPIGREFFKEFSEEVTDCGGSIIASQSYPPETIDFSEPLRQFKLNRSKIALNKGKSLFDFEAFFIPDTYRKTLLIAEAMKQLDIAPPLLLGTAGWDHPALASGRTAIMEGAVFTDGYFVRGKKGETADFTFRFRQAFGIEPTLLEAYAYDSLRMILGVAQEGMTPETLKNLLQNVKEFPGATGFITMSEEGEAQRALFLLTLGDHGIQEIR